jgi:hypothetical protein
MLTALAKTLKGMCDYIQFWSRERFACPDACAGIAQPTVLSIFVDLLKELNN